MPSKILQCLLTVWSLLNQNKMGIHSCVCRRIVVWKCCRGICPESNKLQDDWVKESLHTVYSFWLIEFFFFFYRAPWPLQKYTDFCVHAQTFFPVSKFALFTVPIVSAYYSYICALSYMLYVLIHKLLLHQPISVWFLGCHRVKFVQVDIRPWN